ncbi:MAG: hypothetical protein HYZ53_10065 [Planctomycetes bacterium]|nr:hypothetical protein [Planctomycetota bacterium]
MPLFPPIAAFVALPREARGLSNGLGRAGQGVRGADGSLPDLVGKGWLTATGMGYDRARAAAARFLEAPRPGAPKPAALFALGLCAGLHPGCGVGQVVVATEVAWLPGSPFAKRPDVPIFACDPGLTRMAEEAILATGVPGMSGRMTTTDHMVLTAEEKAGFASMSGSVALDMESAALAEAARVARLPFLALRAVSDVVGETLGADLPRIVTPMGGLRLGGLTHILVHPSSLRVLTRLRSRSDLALRNLASVLEHLLGRVGCQS